MKNKIQQKAENVKEGKEREKKEHGETKTEHDETETEHDKTHWILVGEDKSEPLGMLDHPFYGGRRGKTLMEEEE